MFAGRSAFVCDQCKQYSKSEFLGLGDNILTRCSKFGECSVDAQLQIALGFVHTFAHTYHTEELTTVRSGAVKLLPCHVAPNTFN